MTEIYLSKIRGKFYFVLLPILKRISEGTFSLTKSRGRERRGRNARMLAMGQGTNLKLKNMNDLRLQVIVGTSTKRFENFVKAMATANKGELT
jgi:hypothetical protein